MKRFLIFSGLTYYPCGGFQDFKGSFDTYVEALEFCVSHPDDWHQIVDSTTSTLVYQNENTRCRCD